MEPLQSETTVSSAEMKAQLKKQLKLKMLAELKSNI